MLSYIKLENFRSFKDVTFDLRNKGGLPKDAIFVYGENASGKTNLIRSIQFLVLTFKTLRIQNEQLKLDTSQLDDLLEKAATVPNGGELMNQIIGRILFSLSDIVNRNKSISSAEPMTMEIGFCLKKSNGSYRLMFDEGRVVFEELRFLIKERSMPMFTIEKGSSYISSSVFTDTAYRRELENSILKYWGKHTFLSIMFNEVHQKNETFIRTRLNQNLFIVLDWMKNLSIMCNEQIPNPWAENILYGSIDNLENGTIESDLIKSLKHLEKGLDAFFTALYSDVKKVYYSTSPVNENIKYKLMFQKQIDGKLVDVPFSLESTGSGKLLKIFPYIMRVFSGETVLIDEMDSGIHDLLMCKVVENILESMEETKKGQLIVTTHNTHLMNQLPKEKVYIIVIDANGFKSINCIDDYSFRTQKTNNIRNKYMSGDYAGIPYIGPLDFAELGAIVSDRSDEEDYKA